MTDATPGPLEPYLAFRSRISQQADALFERYAPHLACRRGCYYCCEEITVLPVEMEALRLYLAGTGIPHRSRLGGPPEDQGERPEAIRDRDARSSIAPTGRSVDRSAFGTFAPPPGPQRRCAFLGRAGECTVYEARPVICRTHGLPLAYRVYEYDLHGRELHVDDPQYTDLWCDLNFTDVASDQLTLRFDSEGRINMDNANKMLERLNDEFLRTNAGLPYRDTPPAEERLPLGALLTPGRLRGSSAQQFLCTE